MGSAVTAPPGYDGRPVVLVHLELREGIGIAYCAQVPYVPAANVDPAVPRVLCKACEVRAEQPPALPVPKCARCGTGIGWTRAIQGKRQCEACDLRVPVETESGQ